MTNSEKQKFKQDLVRMTKEEVYKLFRAKITSCKTVAQEVEMYQNDEEYLMLKEYFLQSK